MRSGLRTKRLGNVGAEVVGVEAGRLLEDDGLPAACMDALAESGVLVFRELHIDDETQIAFSQKLDDVGKDEPAEPPRIYKVTLDPTKTATAELLLGTFHWHIDGAQDEVPTKASMLRARTSSRRREARPSSPARTRRTRSSATRSRSGSKICGSCTRSRRRSGWCTRIAPPKTSSAGAGSRTASILSCGSIARVGAPS